MTAVDHAELKRLAEGAGGDAWGLNDWRPEGQILVCGGEGHSYGLFATVDDALPDVAAFIAAANPAVVLALLSEIEGLKAERDRLKLAICGGEDVPGSINAVSVDDCERFIREERSRNDWCAEKEQELAALRTQAPDSWRPIETAPKDGTTVLTYGSLHDDGQPYGIGETPTVKISQFTERTNGWVCDAWGSHEPVWWMPLPAAPALRPQPAESGT